MVRSQSATSLQLFWTILLAYAVKNASSIEYQKARKGEDVILLCNAKKPLNWLNDDNESIGRQIGRIQQNVLGDLTIKSVQLDDSGVYTCTSIDGNIHKQIQLQILAAPTLVNVTRIVEVEKNKQAVMHCEAEGYPDPIISWFTYKDGRRQKFAEGTTVNARMPCQYCKVPFMCQAENKFGDDTADITVNVIGKPEVMISENSVTGYLGKNVTIQCLIKSSPPLEYMQWLKNGKLIQPTNRRKLDFKFRGEYEVLFTLSIENLKEKDFNEYECRAVNKYGTVTQNIQITLKPTKGKPRISSLSATTELVISSGEIQRQEPNSKNQDYKDSKEDAETQSSESVNSNKGSVYKYSWQQFTVMMLISFIMSTTLLLS